MGKGSNAERRLAKKIYDMRRRVAIMRAPASGGRTKREMPDLILLGRERAAIECKYTSKDRVYLPKREVAALEMFADFAGAAPFIGARFTHRDWRFVFTHDLLETPTQYKIERDSGKGMALSSLVHVVEQG